jgi:hypothetical protein
MLKTNGHSLRGSTTAGKESRMGGREETEAKP